MLWVISITNLFYFLCIICIAESSVQVKDTQFAVLYGQKNDSGLETKICVPMHKPKTVLPKLLKNAPHFDVVDMVKTASCKMTPSVKNRAVILDFRLCRDDIVTQVDAHEPSLVIIVSNRTTLDMFPKHPALIAFITQREYSFFMNGNRFNVALYYQNDVNPSHYDFSQLLIFFIAIISVILGSFFAILYGNEYRSNPEESPLSASMEGGHLPWWSFIIILAFFSLVLLLLYFFYNIAIWFLIVLFLIAAPLSAEMLFFKILDQIHKFQDKSVHVQWPCSTGRSTFSVRTLALYPFFLVFGIVWCIYRKENVGIILQNILGVLFCINMIGVVSVGKSLRVLTFMLIALFVYDIFFVFITPLFFKSKEAKPVAHQGNVVMERVKREVPAYYDQKSASIMEQVATGNAGTNNERAPMLLSIPSFYLSQYDEYVCHSGYSMLGFGDIVLPGILVGSMHIFDVFWSNRFRPYFLCSLAGYCIGLGCAHVAVSLTGAGQPALLYIVPALLLPVMILATCRGEFLVLWEGLVPANTLAQNKLDRSQNPNDALVEVLHSCEVDATFMNGDKENYCK